MPRLNQSIIEESSKRLDALNQDIWETGFTTQTLTELAKIVQEVNHSTTLFERIPQAQQPGLSKGSSVLTAAGIICRGCPGTESEVREIYDTDDLVGEGLIQERLVEIWARITGCWFEAPELYLSSLSEMKDFGTESEVYFDVESCTVRKLISLKHYNVLRLALDRVIIHNALFPDSCLKVLGYGRNQAGKFVIVVEQPYCEGGIVPEQECVAFMNGLGFEAAGGDYGMHLNFKTSHLYIGCGGTYIIPQVHVDFSKPCFL